MHHILCESPCISRDFYAIRPLIVWHISGSYFFANMGGGGGQNCFQRGSFQKGSIPTFALSTRPGCRGFVGVIERGVPQAYVRARAPSATLCSVGGLRVFLCIFYQKGNLIRIKTGLDTYLICIQTRTPLSRNPPCDYSKFVLRFICLFLS